MSLTPHQLIENTRYVVTQVAPQSYDHDLAASACKMAGLAVHFDFGDVKPLDAHYEFAQDLWDKKLFRLPADCVMFTWNGERSNAIVASMGHNPFNDHADDLVLFIVGRARTPDADLPNIPYAACSFDDKGDLCWRLLSRLPHPDNNPDHFEAAVKRAFSIIAGYTVMLMSKDIEQQVFPRPDKLNKARAAKGKPAINERRVIRIKAEHRRAYDHAAAEHAAGRSPVMHFRRGHFRTLHRGETEQRVIPVAPCIVNANEDAKPIAKRYEVVK